jgi:hypothetical protein
MDSDSMVFKALSSEPYTEMANLFMEQNDGIRFIASERSPSQNAIENRMKPVMAVMLVQLVHAKLSAKLWGYSFLHAVLVVTIRPVTGSSRDALAPGATPFSAYYGYHFDYSRVLPFGSFAKAKLTDAKPNTLAQNHVMCLLVGLSPVKPSFSLIKLSDGQFVTSYHATFDTDMTRRPAMIYQHDWSMHGAGLTSDHDDAKQMGAGITMPIEEFNRGIRSLFRSSNSNPEDSFIVFSELTMQPIKMEAYTDEHGDLTVHEIPQPVPATQDHPPLVPQPQPKSTEPPISSSTAHRHARQRYVASLD